MLIEELLGAQLVLERGDIELQHDVEDILLMARKNGMAQLNFIDIIGELNHLNPNMFLDPRDEEFKQTLIGVLEQSEWVKSADSSGLVIMKGPEDSISGEEGPGEEAEKEQDKQHDKANKTAMKNVRQGNDSEL